MVSHDLVQIDGSYGEGGGQVIRTGLSLSAITGRPVEFTKVRAGRAKPGLQPQHLTAVNAVAAICSADVRGASIGAQSFTFIPKTPPSPGGYLFDIGTAGAVTLVAQSVLLPLALSDRESQVEVIGGTHVPFAPPAEYLEDVYLPALATCGVEASCRYGNAGFYPRGGGDFAVEISPSHGVRPVDLVERGDQVSLRAYIITSQLPQHVGERGAAAVDAFMRGVGRKVEIERRDRPSRGSGAAVVLTARCENGFAGFTSLGKQGKPMEQVAREACEAFMEWWRSGAACDERLGDQLALPMALAQGPSRWRTPRVTEHLRTVLWIAQRFLDLDVSIDQGPAGDAVVTMAPVP